MSVLVLAFFSISVVSAFSYYFHKQNSFLKRKLEKFEQQLSHLQNEKESFIKADLVFVKQLQEINHQLISMDNQLQGLTVQRDNDGGYQHALRILDMGGNKEEIMNSCHLSSAEAELLMNLNAYRVAIKS